MKLTVSYMKICQSTELLDDMKIVHYFLIFYLYYCASKVNVFLEAILGLNLFFVLVFSCVPKSLFCLYLFLYCNLHKLFIYVKTSFEISIYLCHGSSMIWCITSPTPHFARFHWDYSLINVPSVYQWRINDKCISLISDVFLDLAWTSLAFCACSHLIMSAVQKLGTNGLHFLNNTHVLHILYIINS